jgi:DNA-binding NtrC family response regulator
MIAISIERIGLALSLLFLKITMKVLIIELEKTLQQSLSNFMERNDFDVVVGHSVQEGMSLFNKSAFDMVICGDRLPDGSGLEMLKKWMTQNPKLISILMTVRKDDLLEQEATKAGIKGYLEKPFDLKRLEEVMGIG